MQRSNHSSRSSSNIQRSDTTKSLVCLALTMFRAANAFSVMGISSRQIHHSRHSIHRSLAFQPSLSDRDRLHRQLFLERQQYQHCINVNRITTTAAVSHARTCLRMSSTNADTDADTDTDTDADTDTDTDTDTNQKNISSSRITTLSQNLHSSIQKTITNMTKKQLSLQKELDKAKQLEQTMKRANLIISNLYQLPPGTASATLQDWDNDGEEIEIVFDTDVYSSPQEEADALFALARKMKRGSQIVETLLVQTKDGLDILNEAMMDLEAILPSSLIDEDDNNEDAIENAIENDIDEGRLYLILERLERTSSQTGFVMKQTNNNNNNKTNNKRNSQKQPTPTTTRYQPSFRKFISPNNCIVLVGKNRRDNEAICFQVAKPTDIWFHARGCPGAHVLLQIRRGSPKPTAECMQFAANLAAFYSDARTERKADITTASPRHIQKPRGAPPGAVKLREELETWTGYPERVDDELKVAREESGVIWDESGSRSLGGKVRNRKRTKEVLKDTIRKKRAEKKEKRNNRKADEGSENFW